MAASNLIPIFLPLLPGLADTIIEAVEKFMAKEGTPQENRAALQQVVTDLHEVNAQVLAQPRPGDEVPPA